MATMGAEARSLVSAIDRKDVVQKLVREGTPQEIANTIWAMVTMGAEARNLASAVDRKDVVQKIVQEGSPQNISNTIWAMASMKVECPRLVNGIEGDAERIMKDGDTQHISNIAYALADLDTLRRGCSTLWLDRWRGKLGRERSRSCVTSSGRWPWLG